ncbi:MAG: WD40 repeat domain-containing protein, partial [Candidatus Hermodarchaeota archaeon]
MDSVPPAITYPPSDVAITEVVASLPTPPNVRFHSKTQIWSLDFSPDGSLLASGSADTHGEDMNTIKLWDLTTGESFLTLSGHNSWVYSVSFSPKDEILMSGSPDETLKLWNLTDGKIIKNITDNLNGIWGDSVVFSPDGTVLTSGDENGIIWLWNVAIGS